MVDRIDSRRAILFMFLVVSLGVALMSVAPNYWLVMAAGTIPGIALGLANPATNRMLATNAPVHRQGLYMGIKSSGGQLAAMGVGITLPVLGANFGWRWAMISVSSLGVAGFFASRFFLPRDKPSKKPVQKKQKINSFRWVLIHGFCTSIALGPIVLYLPLYTYERLDASPVVAGMTTAIFGGVSVVARLAWGSLADRRMAIRKVLFIVSILSSVFSLTIALAEYSEFWILWIGVVGFGATAGAWVTLAMVGLIRMVKFDQIGHASGLLQFVGIVGFLMGPILFGLLVEAVDSYTGGLIVAAALFCLAGIIAFPRGAQRRLVEIGDEMTVVE